MTIIVMIIYQVIQSVTFSSPNVGGYQQPFKKGHLTTLPETNIKLSFSVRSNEDEKSCPES